MKHPRLIHNHDARNGVPQKEKIINALKLEVLNQLDTTLDPWASRMTGNLLIIGISEGNQVTIFECDRYIEWNYKSPSQPLPDATREREIDWDAIWKDIMRDTQLAQFANLDKERFFYWFRARPEFQLRQNSELSGQRGELKLSSRGNVLVDQSDTDERVVENKPIAELSGQRAFTLEDMRKCFVAGSGGLYHDAQQYIDSNSQTRTHSGRGKIKT